MAFSLSVAICLSPTSNTTLRLARLWNTRYWIGISMWSGAFQLQASGRLWPRTAMEMSTEYADRRTIVGHRYKLLVRTSRRHIEERRAAQKTSVPVAQLTDQNISQTANSRSRVPAHYVVIESRKRGIHALHQPEHNITRSTT